MTCSDWELEIASESESPALAEHLKECAHCREFGQEMAANRAALGSLTVDEAALTAVRSRVLGKLQRRRSRVIPVWAWAAAACLALVGISAALWNMGSPVPPRPMVTAKAPPASTPQADVTPVSSVPRPTRAHPRRMVARRVEAPSEPLVVKMLTNDPNIVIVWLVDKKEGDSL